MSTVISVHNLCKTYRLGTIGHSTLRADFSRLLARLQGKPDPTLKIGQEHHARLVGKIFHALDDVSFTVNEGEILGIIGRNGAGKSTLLKILSRVTAPTSGEVRIKGRIASLLEVGTGFHPELTGRENIFLNGAILGMTKLEIKRKFDEIVAFSGVEDFIDTPVKRYSSGMYVRLAFAVAAHLESEILIVDEVLAVGDAEFQKKCLGKMNAVATGGRTVIFVSHNIPTVEELCTRVLYMAGGKIVMAAKTREAVNCYLKQSAANSMTRLEDRTDRFGVGNVRLTSFELVDFAGELLPICRAGDDVQFRLRYSVKPGIHLRDCRIGFSIHTKGRPYILLSTEMTRRERFPLVGEGYVDFKVSRLPLGRESYTVTPYIESSEGLEDYVEEAITFDVEDGNYYGVYQDYPPDWEGNTVLTPHSWELNS